MSLALAVALWMAGAGCLLGCESMTMAASPEIAPPAIAPGVVVAGEACASTSTMMQSHDCCARRAHAAAKAVAKARFDQSQFETVSRKQILTPPNDKLSVIENTSSRVLELGAEFPTMMDCPLAVNATAVLSKAGADDSNIALPTSGQSGPLSNLTEQTNVQGRPLRLPNRGHTYLSCCVFLI